MKTLYRFVFFFCLSYSSLPGYTQQNETYFIKHVSFPEGASLAQKTDMAARLIPTRQQLEWQNLELTAFLHFGINTFTGNEWGNGKEDPNLFNPTELNAEQWVKTLKRLASKWSF